MKKELQEYSNLLPDINKRYRERVSPSLNEPFSLFYENDKNWKVLLFGKSIPDIGNCPSRWRSNEIIENKLPVNKKEIDKFLMQFLYEYNFHAL